MILASGAAGTDYFPFTEGVIYEYEYSIPEGSGTYTTSFSGTADVDGTTSHVLHYAGGVDDGLEHFWSETHEGSKLFHGSRRDMLLPLNWFPPILRIAEPLYVGKIWDVNSRSSYGDSVRVHFEVTAFGDVTVPAGTYQAFTVEETWEFLSGSADNIHDPVWGVRYLTDTAQRVADRSSSYVDGIGPVLIVSPSRTNRLLSFRTVTVQPLTWTQVRMLYR